MKTQSGRKRTAKARKNLLDEIHRLSCRGFSQSEIARKSARRVSVSEGPLAGCRHQTQ